MLRTIHITKNSKRRLLKEFMSRKIERRFLKEFIRRKIERRFLKEFIRRKILSAKDVRYPQNNRFQNVRPWGGLL